MGKSLKKFGKYTARSALWGKGKGEGVGIYTLTSGSGCPYPFTLTPFLKSELQLCIQPGGGKRTSKLP
jgi:hypothetical protein